MSQTQDYDPDLYTKMMALTSTYHCDMYPALEAAQNTAAGKVVLVTGASRGIGAHIAKAFAKGGATGIVICARKASSLESITAELRSINVSTEVLAQACDVTQPSDVASLFSAIKEKFGRLDVVVANVGIANEGATMPKIGDSHPGPDDWWDIVATNIRSTYLTAHHYIQTFGPNPTGTVIVLSSGAAAIVVPGFSAYSLSKLAITRLAEFLDVEYPTLQVFALDPGIVKHVARLPAFVPFAVVEPKVVGAFSVWLASGKAVGCKGGFVHATSNVEELEKHQEEIQSKGLVKNKFLSGIMGQEGGALGKLAGL